MSTRLTRDNNCVFQFSLLIFLGGFCVKDLLTGKVLLQGPMQGDLYPISSAKGSSSFALMGRRGPVEIWHGRRGHPASEITSLLGSRRFIQFSGSNKLRYLCPLLL